MPLPILERIASARAFRLLAIPGCALMLAGVVFAQDAPEKNALERVEDAAPVELIDLPEAKRVDVKIGGSLFTAYQYDQSQSWAREKPIFYPVLSAGGNQINRQFPMMKVPGEVTDHPHQASMFFTYGAVDGVDYWNIQPLGKRHVAHVSATVEGAKLTIRRRWIDPDLNPALEETCVATFGGGEDRRWMDQDIVLTAARDLTIGDSKEGAWGMRMATTLQEKGGVGRYVNAQGLEMSRGVWGKTSEWVAIEGAVKDGSGGDEEVSVAIFSHPSTLNHPPYWHARDYGLFTVNPFGRRSYDKTQEERVTPLKQGESVHLRFRLTIYSGKPGKDRFAEDYAEFSAN